MTLVLAKCPSRLASISKPVVNELYWYDADFKEMRVFSGSHLEYEYVWNPHLNKYRMEPKVANVEVRTTKMRQGNIGSLNRWWDQYQNYNDTEAEVVETGEIRGAPYMVFDVPEKEISEFVYQLERQGFHCEVG